MLTGHDIFQAGHGGKQANVLEGPSHSQGCNAVRGERLRRPVVEADGAGCGPDYAADDIEQGGLAGAVGSNEAVNRARFYLQADPVEGPNAAKIPGNGLDLQEHGGYTLAAGAATVFVSTSFSRV